MQNEFLPFFEGSTSSSVGSTKTGSSSKDDRDITKDALVLNRPLKPYERTKEEMVLQKITSSKNFTNLFRENTRNEKKPLEAKLKR